MLASLNLKLIALAVAALLAFGCGWKLRDYQADKAALRAANSADAALGKALALRDAREKALAERSAGLEAELAALAAAKQKVQIIREKEYVTKPVYSSCVLPDSGVRLLNDRIAGRDAPAAAPGRPGALPETPAAGKPR